MEGELDTQELKYSMDLDSSSENDDDSSESSKFQEDFLAFSTQELSHSVDLSDLSEGNQSESDESIPDLCVLKPYDFETLVKKIPTNTVLQTTEATTKHIGNTNWCQYALCKPMESETGSLCCLYTNENPDDYY